MRAASIGAAAVCALLLSGCSDDAPAEPEVEVLSASKAGGAYLDAVCPVNDAWDAADLELDRLRIAVGRGADDTTAFAAAMGELAQASRSAADELGAKDRSWPAEVEDEVQAVRGTLLDDVDQAKRVAKLEADEAAEYAWQGAAEAGEAAAAAREVLGLPADPVAACSQWEQQEQQGDRPRDEQADPPKSQK